MIITIDKERAINKIQNQFMKKKFTREVRDKGLSDPKEIPIPKLQKAALFFKRQAPPTPSPIR